MGCCCAKTTAKDAQKAGLQTPPGLVPNTIGKTANAPCSKEILRKKAEQAAKTRVLVLRECGLKKLPDDATNVELAELRTADLAINRMAILPPAIEVWSQLQSLNVSDNILEQLPHTISTLRQMKKLILSRNRLVALPETLGELNLTELKCDGNMLSALPDAFAGNLTSTLEELDVSNNRLQRLPQSICSLRMIVRLLLQQNTLSSLPLQADSQQDLARLQHINAADNCIDKIIQQTLLLPALSELWLKGNPMDRLVLQATPGFEKFAERRKQRLDQKIDSKVVGGVDLTMCGL